MKSRFVFTVVASVFLAGVAAPAFAQSGADQSDVIQRRVEHADLNKFSDRQRLRRAVDAVAAQSCAPVEAMAPSTHCRSNAKRSIEGRLTAQQRDAVRQARQERNQVR